jgi:hypothetical protein
MSKGAPRGNVRCNLLFRFWRIVKAMFELLTLNETKGKPIKMKVGKRLALRAVMGLPDVLTNSNEQGNPKTNQNRVWPLHPFVSRFTPVIRSE